MKKRMGSWRKARETIRDDLSQARDVRSALVNKLYNTDVSCEWMSCPHIDHLLHLARICFYPKPS